MATFTALLRLAEMRRCASLSRQRGMVIGDVSDPRFGNVHSCHESVLREVVQTVRTTT